MFTLLPPGPQYPSAARPIFPLDWRTLSQLSDRPEFARVSEVLIANCNWPVLADTAHLWWWGYWPWNNIDRPLEEKRTVEQVKGWMGVGQLGYGIAVPPLRVSLEQLRIQLTNVARQLQELVPCRSCKLHNPDGANYLSDCKSEIPFIMHIALTTLEVLIPTSYVRPTGRRDLPPEVISYIARELLDVKGLSRASREQRFESLELRDDADSRFLRFICYSKLSGWLRSAVKELIIHEVSSAEVALLLRALNSVQRFVFTFDNAWHAQCGPSLLKIRQSMSGHRFQSTLTSLNLGEVDSIMEYSPSGSAVFRLIQKLAALESLNFNWARARGSLTESADGSRQLPISTILTAKTTSLRSVSGYKVRRPWCPIQRMIIIIMIALLDGYLPRRHGTVADPAIEPTLEALAGVAVLRPPPQPGITHDLEDYYAYDYEATLHKSSCGNDKTTTLVVHSFPNVYFAARSTLPSVSEQVPTSIFGVHIEFNAAKSVQGMCDFDMEEYFKVLHARLLAIPSVRWVTVNFPPLRMRWQSDEFTLPTHYEMGAVITWFVNILEEVWVISTTVPTGRDSWEMASQELPKYCRNEIKLNAIVVHCDEDKKFSWHWLGRDSDDTDESRSLESTVQVKDLDRHGFSIILRRRDEGQ